MFWQHRCNDRLVKASVKHSRNPHSLLGAPMEVEMQPGVVLHAEALWFLAFWQGL